MRRERLRPTNISWTDERKEAFRRLWPTHGSNWDGWKEALDLPYHPTVNQLYKMASELDVHYKRGCNPYTDEQERELERIIEWYCKRHGKTFGSVTRKLATINRRRYVESKSAR